MKTSSNCSTHLLIVDDDPIVCKLHKRILMKSAFGGNIQVFSNGKLALDYIQENSGTGHHHLILLDINMPIMNGWKMLDALQEKNYEALIHVIMVTSSLDNDDKKLSQGYKQVVGYLIKPLRKESLDTFLYKPEIKAFKEAINAQTHD
mgnify:CR=1 FL=1